MDLDLAVLTFHDNVNTLDPLLHEESKIVYASVEDIQLFNEYCFYIKIQEQALHSCGFRVSFMSLSRLPETAQIPYPEFLDMLDEVKSCYAENNNKLLKTGIVMGTIGVIVFLIKLFS